MQNMLAFKPLSSSYRLFWYLILLNFDKRWDKFSWNIHLSLLKFEQKYTLANCYEMLTFTFDCVAFILQGKFGSTWMQWTWGNRQKMKILVATALAFAPIAVARLCYYKSLICHMSQKVTMKSSYFQAISKRQANIETSSTQLMFLKAVSSEARTQGSTTKQKR